MTKYVIYAMIVISIIVYYPILSFMVYNWKTNPDYSHGFLIVPLAIYFAYERAYDLRRAKLGGSWWGVVLLAGGVFSLLIGELGGLLTALRSGWVITMMGLVLLLAGKQVFRVLLFPMVFMFLMVPLPQSLVNIIAFPLQLTCFLSRPRIDYAGGESLLVEQMPRTQLRGDAINPRRGDMVIFPAADRPVPGRRGFLRASVRHGVSRITRGSRFTLGVIFHDAR